MRHNCQNSNYDLVSEKQSENLFEIKFLLPIQTQHIPNQGI